MKPKNWLELIVCIAIPQAVGGIAGVATTSNLAPWYASLKKPSFNPPAWVFGPVWTALYLLMGIGLFLVWKAPAGPARRRALMIFSVQLALNFAWSFLFFGSHRKGLALVEIVLLWLAILLTILAFRRVNRTAAWLQIPYLLWVTFASILNAALWKLN